MNRRSPGFQLSKAFVGYEQYKAAEGLSPNTLSNYKQHRRMFIEFAGTSMQPGLQPRISVPSSPGCAPTTNRGDSQGTPVRCRAKPSEMLGQHCQGYSVGPLLSLSYPIR